MKTVNVCGHCHRGYHAEAWACPWCGTTGHPGTYQQSLVERTCDVEVYPNYFLAKFDPPEPGTSGEFQMFDGHPLDAYGLHRMLTLTTVVTFNGNHYDLPILSLAIVGADNATLKRASDEIIHGNMQPWQFYDRWKLRNAEWIDTIDMIEVAPGKRSLKEYGGLMHAPKLQDLPYEPDHQVTWFDRVVLREYCGNDLATTWMLRKKFSAQITLREQMTAEFGVELRSKSDAQIAEAIMKKLTGLTSSSRVDVPEGTQFYYRPPPWMRFQTLNILDVIARSPFTVNYKGGIEQTQELADTHIRIGGTTYHMGIGGLHSTDDKLVVVADDVYAIRDIDAASYYPFLIKQTGMQPPAIGDQFQPIYCGWIDTRLLAKRAGDKKKADSLKTLLNGTFGKTNSKWSIFYSPKDFIQITVGGQLQLLMLIEMLEMCGLRVVSANTDGIVVKYRRDSEWLLNQCVKWWESVTGFETEFTDYRFLAARDVNNYMAMKTDGTIKRKGAYAPPEPVATSWPNPAGEICQDALVAYFSKGVPFAETIRACRDVRKFVHVRKVKGGGTWNGEFLGKAVRWYYATGETAPIVYRSNGNKVPDSDGCRPLMELPDVLPVDIDYDRYLADARKMMADLGVQA